jgi:hypothetical protein
MESLNENQIRRSANQSNAGASELLGVQPEAVGAHATLVRPVNPGGSSIEAAIAVRASRLASREPEILLLFTPLREPSGGMSVGPAAARVVGRDSMPYQQRN